MVDIAATIGPRPEGKFPSGKPKYSMHRTLNHKGYEPGNVEWATAKKQAARENRRIRPLGLIKRNSIIVGDTNLKHACRRAGVSYDSVWLRLKHLGETPQQAIAHFEERRLAQMKKRELLNDN